MLIGQFSPLHYGSMIKIPELRPEISKAQIASALKKINAFEKNIGNENKIKVEMAANNIAKINGISIHYRVCTKRPNSRHPWYSISKSKLDDLKINNIDTIICIFFADEDGSSYKIRYKIWTVDEIQKSDDWKKANDVLYRWNPPENDMISLKKEVAKGNIK